MVTVDGDDDDDDDDDGNCRLAERLVSMYKLRSQRSNGILETPRKKKKKKESLKEILKGRGERKPEDRGQQEMHQFSTLRKTVEELHALRVCGTRAEPRSGVSEGCFFVCLSSTLGTRRRDCDEERRSLAGSWRGMRSWRLAVSSRARIWGDCSTIHPPPPCAFFSFT